MLTSQVPPVRSQYGVKNDIRTRWGREQQWKIHWYTAYEVKVAVGHENQYKEQRPALYGLNPDRND